jgi:hypothetical protein
MLDITNAIYPACVGLSSIGNSRWPWQRQRTEVWTDMISRPYPWYLRVVPDRFIWYNKQGAILTFNKRIIK